MSIVELNNLEFQVDALIHNMEQLKTENRVLRTQLAHSQREKTKLKDKNQKAVSKIKRIISQLKEDFE